MMLLILVLALMSFHLTQSAIYKRLDFSPSLADTVDVRPGETSSNRVTYVTDDDDEYVASPKFFVRTESRSSAEARHFSPPSNLDDTSDADTTLTTTSTMAGSGKRSKRFVGLDLPFKIANAIMFPVRDSPGQVYFNDANPAIVQVDNGLSGYQANSYNPYAGYGTSYYNDAGYGF